MTKFLVDKAANIPEGKLKNITAGGKEIVIAMLKVNTMQLIIYALTQELNYTRGF